jgi:hypothetical protein
MAIWDMRAARMWHGPAGPGPTGKRCRRGACGPPGGRATYRWGFRPSRCGKEPGGSLAWAEGVMLVVQAVLNARVEATPPWGDLAEATGGSRQSRVTVERCGQGAGSDTRKARGGWRGQP